MKGRFIFVSVIISVLVAGPFPASAAEKLKFATAVKVSPNNYLPVMVAEEKGFWKENNLQVEWVPFRGGGAMFRSVAAGAVRIGFSATPSAIQAAARGVPVLSVLELMTGSEFVVWVRTQGPIRQPKDLKGAKIGVSRFGGSQHAYGRVVARALGLEKEITFISTGRLLLSLAALKTGKIDAMVTTPRVMVMANLKGEARSLVPVVKYLPSPWSGVVVFARRDLVEESPATVQRAIRAVLKATGFIRENPGWSMDKMKQVSGYSDQAVRLVYEGLKSHYSPDGKINPKAMANARKFLIDFGIIAREKVPDVADLYTNRFTR